MTLLLKIYVTIVYVLSPLSKIFFVIRIKKGKEDPRRIQERYGVASKKRPNGKIIWFHGASIGEMRSAIGVAKIIQEKKRDISILITSGTQSSAAIAKSYEKDGITHQMLPLDHPKYINRFIDHWKPEAIVFMESEIWPNIILGAKERKIKLVLINAKLSDKSFSIWKMAKKSFAKLVSCFNKIYVASEEMQSRFMYFGINPVIAPSPKYLSSPGCPGNKWLGTGNRKILLATCIHYDEYGLMLDIFYQLKNDFPDLLLVIAPRKPEYKIEAQKIQYRSVDESPSANTDVFVIDTFGELASLYAYSSFAILGGAFFSMDGHNVLEPLSFGCSVITGDRIKNQDDIISQFAGACFVVNKEGLCPKAKELLTKDFAKIRETAISTFSIMQSSAKFIYENLLD